jgi:hypothetical protein
MKAPQCGALCTHTHTSHYTSGSGSLLALLRETRSIPIVFAQVFDPVGAGFVKSLARPGGNVTGFTPAEFELGGKMLEILKGAGARREPSRGHA